MRNYKKVPEFKVKKPVTEIPKSGYDSPYDPIIKSVMNRKKGEITRIEWEDEATARRMQGNLRNVFPGYSIKVPKGSRSVYIGDIVKKQAAKKPARKKAKKK